MAFANSHKPRSIETEHFDVNPYQLYLDIYEGRVSEQPSKQSKDVFDFICKVLNFRSVIMKIWKAHFARREELLRQGNVLDDDLQDLSFDIEQELDFGGDVTEENEFRQTRSRHTGGSKDSTSGKIFRFDVEDVNLVQEKRQKKFSEEIFDEIDNIQTPIYYKRIEEPPKRSLSLEEKCKLLIGKLGAEDLLDLNLVKEKSLIRRNEVKLFLYCIAFIGQLIHLQHVIFYKLLTMLKGAKHVFNTTSSQVVLKLKIISQINEKTAALNIRQPERVSILIKEVSFIYNHLVMNFIDLLFGVVLFLVFLKYGTQIEHFIRGLQEYIHPNVFKGQLSKIGENPAGVKLNLTYCGIISKLTQIIFIVQ
jgi:hypothetical protein